jgi:hypothetical protein
MRVDAMSKNDGLQKRVAVIKLQKDFERVKLGIQGVTREASSIEISRDEQNAKSETNPSATATSLPGGMKLLQTMQGKEVDEAIMEERERDIRKINEDLLLVKEMFRYNHICTYFC